MRKIINVEVDKYEDVSFTYKDEIYRVDLALTNFQDYVGTISEQYSEGRYQFEHHGEVVVNFFEWFTENINGDVIDSLQKWIRDMIQQQFEELLETCEKLEV